VATKVYKPQQGLNVNTTSADMALERKDNWGSLRIAQLDNDSGLFAATALLAVDDEVLFFNTVHCAGLDAQVITRAIQDEPDSVSIVTKKKRLQWSGPNLADGAVLQSPQQQQQHFDSPEMIAVENDRPEFLEVVVWKEQPDVEVGVSLKRMGDDMALRVSHLNPNGLLGRTPLRFGDTLRKINNQEVPEGMTVREAIELLRKATGRLAIVVENTGGNPELLSTTVSRQPEGWRSKEIGVSLRQHREGPLCIHGLHQSGLFAESLLRKGDQVRLINDFDCRGLDCGSAIRMMNEDTEFLTIVAARKQVADLNPQTRPEMAESMLLRANTDVTVGVTFTMDDDGRTLRISSLDPCGLLSDSPFCVGDKLVRINNSSVGEYMSEGQAEALVREAMGTLSLVVQNESGDSSLVTSMVQKPTAESSPGISLESSGSAKTLCISGFYAYGLFGQSLLNVGDHVLSINNVECANLDAETAMNRSDFARARTLTITVKRHQDPVHVEVDPFLDMLDDVSYVATVVAEVETQKPSAGAAQENGAYAQTTEAVAEPERHHAVAERMGSYAMATTVQAVPTSSMIPDDATVFGPEGTRIDKKVPRKRTIV
jgi:type II secretory pathway component PulC